MFRVFNCLVIEHDWRLVVVAVLVCCFASVVAVSLLLSGTLTWVLVRNLEFQSAQGQLDFAIQVDRVLVRHQECFNPPLVATNEGPAACRLDDAVDFEDRLAAQSLAVFQGKERWQVWKRRL